MRREKRTGNIYKPIITGAAIAIITSILLAAVTAVFLDNETLHYESVPYISLFVWFVSGLLGVFLSGYTGEGKWLIRCAAAGGVYYIALLCIGIFIYDGVKNTALYGLIAVLLGAAVAIFIIAKRKKAPNARNKRKFRSR